MSNTLPEHADITILGSGPAGMQAALVTSRTRKKIVVFDDPKPPRNGASHGVHNFLGLENLLPAEIRETAWKQIDEYHSAELRKERVLPFTLAGSLAGSSTRCITPASSPLPTSTSQTGIITALPTAGRTSSARCTRRAYCSRRILPRLTRLTTQGGACVLHPRLGIVSYVVCCAAHR